MTITIPVTETTIDALSDDYRSLVIAARRATYRSYAPYSRFSVGAAILLSDGQVITGSNQENAAFPSGICAERTACFYAGSSNPEASFMAIAIAARDEDGGFIVNPISPCGACRQSLLEYETRASHDVPVILAGREKIYILPSIRSTLPLAFTDF